MKRTLKQNIYHFIIMLSYILGIIQIPVNIQNEHYFRLIFNIIVFAFGTFYIIVDKFREWFLDNV